MNTLWVTGGVIFGLLLAEQRLSRRHERLLRACGAVEPPGDVYRAMAVAYPLAFAAMIVEGLVRAASGPATPGGPSWFASGVVMFAAAKALKYWAIAALGDRWSFRVLVERGRPLVTTGPYRYVAHPNYVAVAGELAGAAMMFEALLSGPIGFAVLALLLRRRVQVETKALKDAAGPAGRLDLS